jgi:hypothetical protein
VNPTRRPEGEIVVVDESVQAPEAGEDQSLTQALAMDEPRQPPEGCAFSKWLFRQQDRPDLVGQLAHVVARDPTWRGADTKKEAVDHLVRMGARRPTADLMGIAFDEFHRLHVKQQARDKAHAKARAKQAMQKAARRRNRR